MEKGKLWLKGPLAFIHAVSAFAEEWQIENRKSEGPQLPEEPLVQPNFGGLPFPEAGLAQTPEAPAPEKPKGSRKSGKAKAAEEAAAAQPEPTSSAPDVVPVPDWLQAPAAQANPFQQLVTPSATEQPWLTPAAVTVVQPSPFQAPAGTSLEELTSMLQVIANNPGQRNTAVKYFEHSGFTDLSVVPRERYDEVKNVFSGIISGAIAI